MDTQHAFKPFLFSFYCLISIFILSMVMPPALAATFTAFGPQDFTRGTGQPMTDTVTFNVTDVTAAYTINIDNGGHDHTGKRVSAAVIILNGETVFSPNDFNQNTATLSKPVVLQTSNTLTVELRGKPDGILALEISGETLNRAPVIISTPVMTARIDENYQYQVEALDADGDTLEYILATALPGMAIARNTGLIEWLPETSGQVSVEVQVNDGQLGIDTQQYTLTVIDPAINYAPEIISTAVIEGIEEVLYEYQVEAADLNDDTLTYSLTAAPIGMSIDAESGLIRWASPLAGAYPVEVTVDDPNAASDQQTYTLTVLTLEEADTMLRSIWNGMLDHLIGGNSEAALNYLTGSGQAKYGPIFAVLLPYMDEVFSDATPLERISILPDIAEYAVTKVIDGQEKLFFIYFLRGDDGQWKLEAM